MAQNDKKYPQNGPRKKCYRLELDYMPFKYLTSLDGRTCSFIGTKPKSGETGSRLVSKIREPSTLQAHKGGGRKEGNKKKKQNPKSRGEGHDD